MDHEEFRRRGHQLIDWIADYRRSVASRPVMAQTAPGAVRAKLPAEPPQQAEPFDAIVADLDAVIMPGLSHWQHPAFFGYFPSNGTHASVLGDFTSTGLGVLGRGVRDPGRVPDEQHRRGHTGGRHHEGQESGDGLATQHVAAPPF